MQLSAEWQQQILQTWASGQPPRDADIQQMRTAMLADASRSQAFGIGAENVDAKLQQRIERFQRLYPGFVAFCGDRLGWQPDLIRDRLMAFWDLWLPLAIQLVDCRQNLGRPLIQGILGGQGTGKTTLAAILTWIIADLGYQTCSLSIDDLYKTYAERQQLQQIDPRLRWRGPPGTHDVELGLTVLQQLQESAPSVAMPRFDKSAWNGMGDRAEPEIVSGADLVLFEGWFVGVRPIAPAHFDQAPSPIDSDTDRQFARDINEALRAYLPLWEQLDRLIVLAPVDYRLSQTWRREAEQQMKASGRSGMSDREIDEFVLYFWRSLHPELFIAPLCQSANHTNMVIEIRADHSPGRVYAP